MAADREQIIRIAAKVQALREQLRIAELELDRAIGPVAAPGSDPKAERDLFDERKGREASVPDRIRQFLGERPGKWFTAVQVAEALEIESRDYSRVALKRLAEKKAVEWDEKEGKYRIAS